MSDWEDDFKAELKKMTLKDKLKHALYIDRYSRPLTKTEKYWHLPLDKASSLSNKPPHDNRSILSLNSNFLEVINPKYGHKGLGLSLGVLLLLPAVLFGCSVVLNMLWNSLMSQETFLIIFDSISTVVMLLMTTVVIYMLYQDIWPYTHYPIRFCRKNKMVYVLQRNKPTVSIEWKNLYFLMYVEGEVIPGTREYKWMLQAHRLDSDNLVQQSFFLSPWVESNDDMRYMLLPYWEYIRRYMEEGPQSIPIPEFMIPIGKKRESLALCWQQLKYRYLDGAAVNYLILGWLIIPAAFIRWIALRIAPRPKWPEEIEAACKIEAGDPYHYEGSPDGVPIKITT